MSLQLHAQPYDTSAIGFYFDSVDDFETKFNSNLPVEEYEIQFINGTDTECTLCNIVDPCQSTLEKFFDLVELDFSDDQLTALCYLVEQVGYSLEDGLNKIDVVELFKGTKTEYAEQLIDDCYNLEGIAQDYFDYERFGNDLEMGGDITEIETDVWVTNHNNL